MHFYVFSDNLSRNCYIQLLAPNDDNRVKWFILKSRIPIFFSHINSGIIPFNIQVHLLDLIAWTLKNEAFHGVMVCTGWTRMEEAIAMHFRPTVT